MIRLLTLMACMMFSMLAMAETKTIVLSDKNTVTMRYAFTDESVSKLTAEILEKDAKLPKGEPIYLFIDSPGGSVTAGMDFIQGMTSLGREIKTISSFSASMAFMTVQSLGERIVLPFGVLMSHRAKGGIQGQFPGEIDTRYVFWKTYLEHVSKLAADRLNLSVEQYELKHYDEWWTHGSQAIKEGTADSIANVKCDKTLIATVSDTVNTMFGPVSVVWSKCPLVKTPLKVDMTGILFTTMNESEKRDFLVAMNMFFYNKVQFLHEYVITGKISRILN